MNNLKKITAQSAGEILDLYESSDDLKQILQAQPKLREVSPAQLIEHLLDNQAYLDLVKFLAHAIPKRESIWWCCQCTKAAIKADESSTIKAALATAEAWVQKPSEALRRKSEKLATLTEHAHAASWAAQAAFWASGSITPEGEPMVPPPPYLYTHAVFGAIALAVAAHDPEDADKYYQSFIQQGLDIAAGGRGEAKQNIICKATVTEG